MDSILETQRKLHEERERTIDTIVKEVMSEKKTHKAKINSEQRVKQLVDRYHGCTEGLERLYEDLDGARKREMNAIAGPNEFAEFYSRLKLLKDAHRRNPDEEMADPERPEIDMVQFTDEEGYGRFLDLHALFVQYINLKAIKRIDYITYIGQFEKFADIPRNTTKKTGAYKEYLLALKAYLASFIERTRPMFDIHEEFNKVTRSLRMRNDIIIFVINFF
uniref:SF3A3 domain-containing protein n=1 Tax=Heterorhabditis bacteriophora TaxID=37862 RepID=A0A1I7XUQ6_HETBA